MLVLCVYLYARLGKSAVRDIGLNCVKESTLSCKMHLQSDCHFIHIAGSGLSDKIRRPRQKM